MRERNSRVTRRQRRPALRFIAVLLALAAGPAAAQTQAWTVGAPIAPPDPGIATGVTAKVAGEVLTADYFFYDAPQRKAYWLQPTPAAATATLTWQGTLIMNVCSNDPCNDTDPASCVANSCSKREDCCAPDDQECLDDTTVICGPVLPTSELEGTASWPPASARILHVAGAPVDLAPRDPQDPENPSQDWTLVGVAFPASGVQQTADCENAPDPSRPCLDPDSKIFNRIGSGTSALPVMTVLEYNRGTTVTGTDLAFQVVETVAYTDYRLFSPVVQEGVACTVGSEINTPRVVFPGSHIPRPYHRDLTGKNGYVLNRLAFYDGAGPDAAYDRATRSGQIIPVNSRGTEPDNGASMLVAWYRERETPQAGEDPVIPVAWPDYPVHYTCEWPEGPDRIVIASGTGSEVDGQPELRESEFPTKRIYRQRDPDLSGYNPNDEHALLGSSNTGTESAAVYAVRSDLHKLPEGHPAGEFEAHVLLKYRKPASPTEWAFKVYDVVAEDASSGYEFEASATAGDRLRPLAPLGSLGECPLDDPETTDTLEGSRWTPEGREGDAHYRDSKGGHWATAKTPIDDPIVAEFFYPRQQDFAPVGSEADGECIPWLSGLETDETPVDFVFHVDWPSPVLTSLKVGETLTRRVRGLPEIMAAEGVRVVSEFGDDDTKLDPGTLVHLYDPLTARGVPLRAGLSGKLPGELQTTLRFGKQIPVANALTGEQIPASIRERLAFDPLAGASGELSFAGVLDESGAGLPRLVPNVMSERERDDLKAICCQGTAENSGWDGTVNDLWQKTRNPTDLDLDENPGADDDLLVSFEPVPKSDGTPDYTQKQPVTLTGLPKALSAGLAQETGWVTVSRNDHLTISGPVDIQVIKLDCGPFGGEIAVVPSENIFDEQLTLRHSADFAGDPGFDLDPNTPGSQHLVFEWWRHPAPKPDPGEFPDSPGASLWQQFDGSGPQDGQVEVTIDSSAPEIMLSDNYFFVRYKGNPACGVETWSPWAGAPGNIPRSPLPQLAESWIKRVMRRLNPFDARVRDFHAGPAVNTIASQIAQAGPRYEGDIAFSEDPDNLNDIGLIESYETVVRRGSRLSIDAPNPISSPGVNQSLLFGASRVADLYMLLGNEAFVDAADPTIAVGTDDGDLGSLAPSIFSFENQLPSLLEEELALLRGRDDTGGPTAAPPVYNRLFWNFTSGVGQVAYKLNYDITDQDLSGIIDVDDAKILYPQGHGDAWGHYLSAIKSYYRLLRHPQYAWLPRAEDVLVGGVPIQVDFLDERKLARAAAALAKTGAQIVDLAYRQHYVEDPEGQWQGYRDTDAERAWGVDGWARRAAQGAYFDWVVGNAVLPSQDLNPDHEGVQIIDRQRVTELGDIAGQLSEIQARMDDVDLGLNPLGLAKGVVPFDINPALVTPPFGEPQTHFEQIYDRALEALRNAVDVWDYANQLTQRLRSTQDDADQFLADSKERELDFKNRLIEIFGTPYDGDIGVDGTYPAGYDGADLYHWMYVDTKNLTGQAPRPSEELLTIIGKYRPIASYCPVDTDAGKTPEGCPEGAEPGETKYEKYFNDSPNDSVTGETFDVEYPIDPDQDYRFEPPADWGDRQAPGELQFALSDLLQSELALEQALLKYDNKLREMRDQVDLLEARFDFHKDEMEVISSAFAQVKTWTDDIGDKNATQKFKRYGAAAIKGIGESTAECIPKELFTVGFSNSAGDALSGPRCALLLECHIGANIIQAQGDAAEIDAHYLDIQKDDLLRQIEWNVRTEAEHPFEVKQHLKVLEGLLRDEAELRSEVYAASEIVKQNDGRQRAILAKGLRLLEERQNYRTGVAAATSESRYRDMAFRIFRNDALQKYKAQFDLAARYAYLAATAYDYETNLLGTNNAAGRRFLADIVRHRSLGQVIDGEPVAGTTGIADPLARMAQNFAVLKSQLGFNNPRMETNRFSLRRELFRELEAEGTEWPDILKGLWVNDLCAVPEFRRFARPFAPDSACPQPALVIPFGSTVEYGQNFFEKTLGPGDSAFDPTYFATRVRSVGVWFENYDLGSLSNTPRVYLLPVGEDVLRAPTFDDFRTRPWRVVDQALPVPFPIGSTDLQDPAWIPLHDSLSDSFATIRRFSAFRAYHDDGSSEVIVPEELQTDSRLIGRSVWNTRWLLIIPGAFMLADPQAGLDGFIDSVTDIRVFFETYGYSGN